MLGADDGAVTAPVPVGRRPRTKRSHSSRTARSFGEAKQQLPGLGGVAAAEGHGSGLGAGSWGPASLARSRTPRALTCRLRVGCCFFGREKVPNCGPYLGEYPAFGGPSPSISSPESRQRDTNFARAQLRWEVKRDGPEVVVVIATEVSGLVLVLFSSPP